MAALGVGLAVWTPLPPGIWDDDGVYLLLGRALARGAGLHYLGVPGAPPAAKFPPLYPALTALAWMVGGDPLGAARVASLLNVAFLAGAAALLAAYARRGLGLPLPLALAAGALSALSVHLWRPALVALSEPLYVLVLVGALWAAARAEEEGASWRESAVLAVLLVVLAYVRTAGVAVVGAAVLGLALRRRWRSAVAVGVSVAVALLPWALWSAAATARLPGPLADMLGPYGAWLRAQVADAPGRYLAFLPGAAWRVAVRAGDLLLPPGPLQKAAPLLAAAGLAGAWRLGRRSPTAALALLLSWVLAWIWPFEAERLVLPLLPLLLVGLAAMAADLVPRRGRLAAGALGLLLLWAAAFAGLSAWSLARGSASAPYDVRARTLANVLDELRGRVPRGAVVGAPELWAALPLFEDVEAAPSARFRPLAAEGEPVWGAPREQFRLWRAAGIGYLVLEDAGRVHGKALDSLEAACPGSVAVLDEGKGLALVRLDWDEACRRRVGVEPGK